MTTSTAPISAADREKAKEPIREHHLKAWPEFYDAVGNGVKTFEARLNDRDYAVGDRLFLNRFDPVTQAYVKGWPPIMRYVTYVLQGGQFGVEPGHSILGLAERPAPKPDLQARVVELEAALAATEAEREQWRQGYNLYSNEVAKWRKATETMQEHLARDAMKRAEASEARATALLEALQNLRTASAEYRRLHDLKGDDDIDTGRAWDALRRRGDEAGAAILQHAGASNDRK